jgi:hypothetical protein
MGEYNLCEKARNDITVINPGFARDIFVTLVKSLFLLDL